MPFHTASEVRKGRERTTSATRRLVDGKRAKAKAKKATKKSSKMSRLRGRKK